MNWEFAFLEFLNSNLSGDLADKIMMFFSLLGNGGKLWISAAVVMLFFKNWRKAGVAMLVALAIGFLITNVTVKPLVARMRPFDKYSGFNLIIPPPTDFSFPSGHTCSSFAAAVALMFYKRKTGIAAVVVACITAFSRMYLLVHYPTDIFAGLIIGVASAYAGAFFVNKIKKL